MYWQIQRHFSIVRYDGSLEGMCEKETAHFDEENRRTQLEGMKTNSTAVADLLHLDNSLKILLLLLLKNEGVEWSFRVEKVKILQLEQLLEMQEFALSWNI